jgi:type I restriction enzyme R subunit
MRASACAPMLRLQLKRSVRFQPTRNTVPPILQFGDVLHAQVCDFNAKYKEAEGALVGELQRLKTDVYGNCEFLTYLRNQGKFFDLEEKREFDLTVIDYEDIDRPRDKRRNTYEVTEEFYVYNGRYGTRGTR